MSQVFYFFFALVFFYLWGFFSHYCSDRVEVFCTGTWLVLYESPHDGDWWISTVGLMAALVCVCIKVRDPHAVFPPTVMIPFT
jgi:hypothetical protein